jgi:hypothetical protein
MPKLRSAQSTFVAGEFTPLLAARSDIALYKNGAEKLTNLRPMAQGGVQTRPGMRRLATIGFSPTRLVDFAFNETQLYVLAFSNGRMDPYLPDGTAGTAVTGAPWTAAMLPRLGFVIDGDTIIVLHVDMPPQRLLRTGATTFSLTALTFETSSTNVLRVPFNKFALPAVTLTPGATTGATTLTASAAHFTTDDVGTRYRVAGKQVSITGFTSATVVNATVIETLASTTATADWDEQAWSVRRGWPGAGAFIDNRLVLAGSRDLPAGFWWSKIGAFFNFDLGTALDNEAVWDTVRRRRGNHQIRHVIAAERLLIFTDAGLWIVPRSDQQPLTPKTLAFRQVSNVGASWTLPVELDSAVLYLDTTGRVVREARYDDSVLSYTVDEVSLAAEHLVQSPVQSAILPGNADRPERYAVFLNADGTLAAFHSIRVQKILAWVPWITTGTIESVCATGQELFLVVLRTINGTPVRSLEKLVETAAPLDCAVRATSGSPTRSFSGFTHLAGQLVQVVSKGHDLGEATVTGGGGIALDASRPEVTEIEAGFTFEQRLRPMPLDFDLPDGPARGLTKTKVRAWVQVYRSQQFLLDGFPRLPTFQGDDFATPAPTFTGLVEMKLAGISPEGQCDLVVLAPQKITVLGLTREVVVGA